MISPRRFLSPALLALPLTAVVLAQAPQPPALNVRMGLWEVSSTIDLGGQMPGMDMSKMTPAQQAQMAAAMRGMMGAHTTTTKSCMTREKFNKQNFVAGEQSGMDCKQTFTKNTATVLEGNVSCTGTRSMTGTMHFDATSPTAFNGTMKSATSERGQTMTANVAMSGKWLGADCGDVQ
jgi:hypothetical protein